MTHRSRGSKVLCFPPVWWVSPIHFLFRPWWGHALLVTGFLVSHRDRRGRKWEDTDGCRKRLRSRNDASFRTKSDETQSILLLCAAPADVPMTSSILRRRWLDLSPSLETIRHCRSQMGPISYQRPPPPYFSLETSILPVLAGPGCRCSHQGWWAPTGWSAGSTGQSRAAGVVVSMLLWRRPERSATLVTDGRTASCGSA